MVCAIAATENPADDPVSYPLGILANESAAAPGALPTAGCLTPGTFTNLIQAACWEPRLPVLTDPRADHQRLTEAPDTNLPTTDLSNTDTPLCSVDTAILCNDEGAHSMDLMWWLFAQEVLHRHGISSEPPWKVLPHRCFQRDPEKTAKEEQATVGKIVTKEEFQGGWTAPVLQFMSAPPDLGV